MRKSFKAAVAQIAHEEGLVASEIFEFFTQEPLTDHLRKGILSRSKSSVSFSEPEVQRRPLSSLSDGWLVLSDGMALGVEPGSLVFSDGTRYGPSSVELDLDTFVLPVWGWCRVLGVSKPVPSLLPVRQAYGEFARALAAAPVSIREWSETAFLPPGSSSNRTFLVSMPNNSLIAAFLTGLPKWFEAFASGPKPVG